jgi:alpha-amylase
LKRYRFFDIGTNHYYYDDYANETSINDVAERSYIPALSTLIDMVKSSNGAFKVALSISGVALEQLEINAPAVVDLLHQLNDTGCCEFLAEPYSHGLSSLANEECFKEEVMRQCAKMKQMFGKAPKVLRNSSLIYSDEIGATVASMGFKGMLTEGAKHILGWKSPNYLYTNAINPKMKLLLKNFNLSDDIAFRFSDRSNPNWPVTSDKYAAWLAESAKEADIINLFMDYETFGEHQNASTGILEFMRALPDAVLANTELKFVTPSEAAAKHQPVAPLHVPYAISWADEERDTSAWLGNELQNEAFEKLYSLEKGVMAAKDEELLADYRKLQESDHFYYMCTKFFSDGAVHKYFNPYDTPYEAFINYMNVLSDFALRVEKANNKPKKK